MRAYIGNTDYDWYRYLSGQENLEEVNFWKPSGGTSFKALNRGQPFFFKLKKAHGDAIVGFGLFVLFRPLPVREAWEVFGTSNGAPSLEVMWRRITQYTKHGKNEPFRPNHLIGCILLASPIFFPKEMWVKGPRDWHPNIVSGKGYDTSRGEGRRIWNACMERVNVLASARPAHEPSLAVAETAARYGSEQTFRPRLGQGTFRYAVQDAYRKCAVTREHSLPALEASHILPYTQGGPHEVSNGLLLRADIHRLFDGGYVTVTPEYRFRVSPRLEEEFHNGKVYYKLENEEIWLPEHEEERPLRDHLERHNEEIFLAS